MKGPTLDEAVEWRIPIWAPAVSSALVRAAPLLPSNAKVLEVGYNSGMMCCYMASHFGWNLVGYDIKDSSRVKAVATAHNYGLEEKIDFRICLPEDTLSIEGPYDAVLLKSVLYHISDVGIYRSWLDWLYKILRDGGVAIAIENGKGGLLDRIYRKSVKKSRWANFLLFDREIEQEFRERFSRVDVKYYCRYSHFFSFLPNVLFNRIQSIEEKFCPASADHCLVASVVAQK